MGKRSPVTTIIQTDFHLGFLESVVVPRNHSSRKVLGQGIGNYRVAGLTLRIFGVVFFVVEVGISFGFFIPW